MKFPNMDIYIASLLNCRPVTPGKRYKDERLNLYLDLSCLVHNLLYKFNKTRMDEILQHKQFASLFHMYISWPEFFSASGLSDRPGQKSSCNEAYENGISLII